MSSHTFAEGGYQYLPGVFQYSGGVAAAEGFEIIRVTFRNLVPLAAGFSKIAEHLAAVGRPKVAFCACELRSPAPFPEDGFRSFNQHYVSLLEAWEIVRAGFNPIARTNICPVIAPPSEPGLYAFSYTLPTTKRRPTFVVSGSGEVPEGKSNYADHIISPADTSTSGLRSKAEFVLAAMEARMAAMGRSWRDATSAQVYTIHDIHPLLADLLVTRGAARFGVTWHYARPPVAGLDFEMDCRGVSTELIM